MRILTRGILLLAVITFPLRGSAVVSASDCVDQAINPGSFSGVSLTADVEAAQTVTCQLGGTIEEVRALLTSTGNGPNGVAIGLYSVTPDLDERQPATPLSERLAWAPAPGVARYVGVGFADDGITVTPGQVLAVVIYTTGTESEGLSAGDWIGDRLVGYGGGAASFRALGQDWMAILEDNASAVDFGLEISFDGSPPAERCSGSLLKTTFR